MGSSRGRPARAEPGPTYGFRRLVSRPPAARNAIVVSSTSVAIGSASPRDVIAPALSCSAARTTRPARGRRPGPVARVLRTVTRCTRRGATHLGAGASRAVCRSGVAAAARAATGAAFGGVPNPPSRASTLGRRPTGATGRTARAPFRPIARRPYHRGEGRLGVAGSVAPVSSAAASGSTT